MRIFNVKPGNFFICAVTHDNRIHTGEKFCVTVIFTGLFDAV